MRFLRISEVVARTGLSRTTIARYERAGQFPSRRRLGQGAVGWVEEEVHDWLERRPTAEEEMPHFSKS